VTGRLTCPLRHLSSNGLRLTKALPLESTATQKSRVPDLQVTDVNLPFGSIVTGRDQTLFSNTRTAPSPSTAMHRPLTGHDTESGPAPTVSIAVGDDHEWPS